MIDGALMTVQSVLVTRDLEGVLWGEAGAQRRRYTARAEVKLTGNGTSFTLRGLTQEQAAGLTVGARFDIQIRPIAEEVYAALRERM